MRALQPAGGARADCVPSVPWNFRGADDMEKAKDREIERVLSGEDLQ